MFTVRKGASSTYRRINRSHANILNRSMGPNSLFKSQECQVRCLSASRIRKETPDRQESGFQVNKLEVGNASKFSREPLPFKYSRQERIASKYHLDSGSTRLLLASSQNVAWNCLRSTITTPTASNTVIFEPIDSSLGPSLFGARNRFHQYDSRMSFSSKSGEGPEYSTSAKIPTPKSPSHTSLSPFASFDPQTLIKGAIEMTWSVTKLIVNFILRLPGNSWYYLTHSKERREKIAEIKDFAKKEFDHYWVGTKLLMADVRTARNLLGRTLTGSTLTRRERKQLLRTVSDLFRLVPFSMFLIIPFMEFALPFALRIFPNMLPSTFQDSLKAEENMKRELQSRIAMAQFFQDTLEELAKEQKRIAAKRNIETPDKIASKQEESAASMLEFLDRARNGEMMPPDVIVQYAKYFQDDLTLDNMPRMQLINMCVYMSIPPYGSDALLRFQLRHKIKTLKEDDQKILWEGINSLTKMELREACQERGMRSTGLSKEAYRESLQKWLDLSVNKNVSISLLIMSRIFFLQEEIVTPSSGDGTKSVAGLADAISGLDKEVLNEVILEVATSEEKKSDPDVRKIKLEVLTHQNEKIREEQEEREAAAKKKESVDKAESQVSDDTTLLTDQTELIHEAEKSSDASKQQYLEPEVLEEASTETVTNQIEAVEEQSTEEEKGDHDLSAEEMEAITQLLTADPVSKEREELAKIKSAIKEEEEDDLEEGLEEHSTGETSTDQSDATTTEDLSIKQGTIVDSEEDAATIIKDMETKAELEAEKSTVFTVDSQLPPQESISEDDAAIEEDGIEADKADDPVVAQLKEKIETMVDKIEVQLSDVQVKIGDKLHFLDKDMDGILSQEEIAECLQQVFKREITFEEAMEIAGEMDDNEDGALTVQELIEWIDTNKLMIYESQGRDADMDRIIESHSAESQKGDPDQSDTSHKTEGEKTTIQ